MTRNVQKTLGIRVALAAAVAFPLIIAMSARAQEPAPPPPTGTNVAPAPGAPAATEADGRTRYRDRFRTFRQRKKSAQTRFDTYRRDDITRLGVRTPTDLVLRIPAATDPTLLKTTPTVVTAVPVSVCAVSIQKRPWFCRTVDDLPAPDRRRLISTGSRLV